MQNDYVVPISSILRFRKTGKASAPMVHAKKVYLRLVSLSRFDIFDNEIVCFR